MAARRASCRAVIFEDANGAASTPATAKDRENNAKENILARAQRINSMEIAPLSNGGNQEQDRWRHLTSTPFNFFIITCGVTALRAAPLEM